MRRFISAKLAEMYPTSTAKRKAQGEWSLEAIAEDLGVKKPQIHSALRGPKGIGPKFEEQFARRHFAGSIDKLRLAAQRWAELHPAGEESIQDATDLIESAGKLLASAGDDAEPAAIVRLRSAVESIRQRVDKMPATSGRRRAKPTS